MTRMEEYAFTKADKALPSTPVKTIRGTFDSTWKDQLLTWNGVSMTYDAIGNMVKKGNTTYTWTQGRKLSTVNNGKKIQYFYDHTGRRVRKTVDGVTTDFRMAGELLMSQKAGDVTTYFSYDSAGNLIGMSAGRERYFYTRNAQNDITGLIDENGVSVVQYQYDSWGKLLGITGSLASTIGKRNPFRYRGYYYDDETGMYYLKNRYYDSEIKRFICADDTKVLQAQTDLYNKNLYAYCDNNPIIKKDVTGEAGVLSFVIGAAAGAFSNVATSFITAWATGEEYTMKDVAVDAAVGAVAGAVGTFEKWGTFLSGATSFLYTTYTAYKEGADIRTAVMNGFIDAATSTVNITNATKLAMKPKDLSETISLASDVVFGTGNSLIIASVSKGISMSKTTGGSRQKKKAPAPRRRRVIGKSYYYDPIRKIRRISLIYGY